MSISTYFNNIDDAIRTFTQEGYSRDVPPNGVGTITWDNPSASGLPTDEQIIAKAKTLASDNPVNALRQTRDFLISQSDWMGNQDYNISDEWKAYRQALRDITTTITDDAVRSAMADDINHSSWPTEPS
tara:strand:+ start:491 stop:877 length:387 start_codon:yes stop_codon:yes gene_type:complete